MSTYWDFRAMLNVYPDSPGFTCVGTTQKGTRCGQSYISGSDLSRASRILDEMAAHKDLASTYEYLEELASLTLCPRWHRKPSHSQVSQVRNKWQAMIRNHEIRLRMEMEKASTVAAERALAKMKRAAKEEVVKLEEEKYKAKVAAARPEILKEKTTNRSLQKSGSFVPAVKMEDPFAKSDKTDSTKENLFTKTVPKVQKTFTSQAPPYDITLSKRGGRAAAQRKSNTTFHLMPNDAGLPSPPTSPPDSTTQELTETKLEQCPAVTPTKKSKAASKEPQPFTATQTSSIKVETADAKTSFIAEEKPTVQALNPNYYAKEESGTDNKKEAIDMKETETRKPVFKFGKGKYAPLYTFDPKTTSRLPLTPGDTPPSTNDKGLLAESIKSTAAFNMGSQYNIPSTPFEFETPLKPSFAMRLPEKPSVIWDEFTGSETKKLTKQTPIKGAEINWNRNLQTPETKPEPSKTHEESYGYATTTPPSTRHRIYLPALRQHGLMTPPETPETTLEKSPFVVSFGDISETPSLSIPQKPLPKLPGPPSQQSAEKRASHGPSAGPGDNGSRCTDDDHEWDAGKTGCLRALGLGGMRKRFARKMNTVRTRVSEVIHRRHSERVVDG